MFKDSFPEAEAALHFPGNDQESLKSSLEEYHSGEHGGVSVDDDRWEEAATAFSAAYQAAGFEWEFGIPDGLDPSELRRIFEDRFERIVASVDRTSTPGYPYRLKYRTNGELFDNAKGEVKSILWDRIQRIYYADESEFAEVGQKDPLGWIRKNLRDPVRVFPKKQSQKCSKLLPRVISQISVIDQMIERFFFTGFTEAESKGYPFLPTKKGIGFNRAHAELIGEVVQEVSRVTGLDPIASDVKGWEKNYNSDMANAHGLVMFLTASDHESCTETLERAIRWWSCSLTTCPYVTDEGRLIVYPDFRVQRSGDFLTTSSNGSGRWMCAYLVGSYAICMGDDSLEWTTMSKDELIAAYAKIGLPVRDVEQMKWDDFLFCSHRFKRAIDGTWLCWLDSWQRMLYSSSFSGLSDNSTHFNYLSEVEDMDDPVLRNRIVEFLQARMSLLGAVAEHDKEEKSEQA